MLNRLKDLVKRQSPEPSVPPQNFCPICGRPSTFAPHRGRKGERCTNCGSLIRTRCMYLALLHFGLVDQIKSKCNVRIAHFAPERSLYNALSTHGSNSDYHCFDLHTEKYGFAKDKIQTCDLTQVSATFKPGQFDILLHNHVLEHIPVDIEPLVQDLNDLVRPGGMHMFTIPMRNSAYDEDLGDDLSPEERKKRFGQEDHMRIFSARTSEDWLKTLFQAPHVVVRLNTFLTPELADLFGVRTPYDNDCRGVINGSTVFFYKKPY